MKTMTCRELGGACDVTFSANTFDEIGQLSKEHTKEMFDKRLVKFTYLFSHTQ